MKVTQDLAVAVDRVIEDGVSQLSGVDPLLGIPVETQVLMIVSGIYLRLTQMGFNERECRKLFVAGLGSNGKINIFYDPLDVESYANSPRSSRIP